MTIHTCDECERKFDDEDDQECLVSDVAQAAWCGDCWTDSVTYQTGMPMRHSHYGVIDPEAGAKMVGKEVVVRGGLGGKPIGVGRVIEVDGQYILHGKVLKNPEL